jgi:hypothetical protein
MGMQSSLYSSRRKAALLYTLRGVFYGSLLWPVFTLAVLTVATFWTDRPGWVSPHIKH